MIGVILSLLYNGRMARKLQKTTAEAERKQRQRELALKIVDTIGTDRTAARRFAIGLVKIEKVGHTEAQHKQSEERGKVYFLPVNSRVTVGRDSENDIILHDPSLKIGDQDHNRELSRFQCGFVADEYNVVVEDFASKNGTLVSDPNGNKRMNIGGREVKFVAVQRRELSDGDLIWVAPFVLRFVKLQENKILLQ
jgi:pSer/pThr/pTyr-binding forkhead associated (FHA) protein